MAEEEKVEFTSPHKCIKNTSTNGILTKHLLNTSGRSSTPKRTRKVPMQLGRTKERKEEMGRDQHPWWGAEGEERFLQLKEAPSQ